MFGNVEKTKQKDTQMGELENGEKRRKRAVILILVNLH